MGTLLTVTEFAPSPPSLLLLAPTTLTSMEFHVPAIPDFMKSLQDYAPNAPRDRLGTETNVLLTILTIVLTIIRTVILTVVVVHQDTDGTLTPTSASHWQPSAEATAAGTVLFAYATVDII